MAFLACATNPLEHWILITLGILFIGVGIVAVSWRLWYGRPEILLQETGVTFQDRRYQVFCPWALFNAPGKPFLYVGGGVPMQGTVPVASEAVPLIEIRAGEYYLDQGSRRRVCHLIEFTKPNEIALPVGWFGLNLVEVGSLLLHLGRTLSDQGPPPQPSVTGDPASVEPPARLVGRRDGDWITVSMAQLTFPAVCCRCNVPTEAIVVEALRSRWVWVWSMFHKYRFEWDIAAPLPECEECQANQRRRLRRGRLVGALVGASILSLAADAAVLNGQNIWLTYLWILPLGVLIGVLFGGAIVARPLWSGEYSRHNGTVTFHFRNRTYTDLFLRHLAATTGTQTLHR
jgi:hypothetical protein